MKISTFSPSPPPASKPTGRGVSVYTENDTLPEGDAVISYVMNLNYIKPDEAVRTFTQIIGQFGAFGSIAAVPNAASVVITENTSLIRKLIELKAEIDKPSSQVATRFITVKYADVTELATTLNELLGQQAGHLPHRRSPACPAEPSATTPNPSRWCQIPRWRRLIRRGNSRPNRPGRPHQPPLRHGSPGRSALRRGPRPRVRYRVRSTKLPPPQTEIPRRRGFPTHRRRRAHTRVHRHRHTKVRKPSKVAAITASRAANNRQQNNNFNAGGGGNQTVPSAVPTERADPPRAAAPSPIHR